MKLIALRQLKGEYGAVVEGQVFDAREDIAHELLRRDPQVVRRADLPRLLFQTRVVVPQAFQPAIETPEVSARSPFRDLPVSDPKSAAVATEGDRVVPGADVSTPGDADRGGRRGRARSGTGE